MGLKITLFMADFVKLLNHLVLKVYHIYKYTIKEQNST